ncbi:TIGR01777 family oxidoreductase [Pontiellaceae bacterium B12219]|nr:TIGR01777 family oxidoreductase [Pontiellaceae bacterium B12219]
MKIMISGSHGLVGSALAALLQRNGHTVIQLNRAFDDALDFHDVHAVVHLAGESIAEGRWNSEKKKRIEQSRVGGTQKISQLISQSDEKPSVFISASAIGYYGNRAEEILTEESTAGNDFLSTVCVKWENATEAAQHAGVRTVNLRTGIVLSKQGGALAKMLPPFKLGGGGVMGSGKQYMSWISLDDMVEAILCIIKDKTVSGPVNMTAPHPVTNKEFTKTLGKTLKRPTVMPLPSFAARLIFGEMADALLLSSTRVEPVKLVKAGYQFKHHDLKTALEDILK